MDNGKDKKMKNKRMTKLLSHGKSTIETSKELFRDHWTINRAVENMSWELEAKEKTFISLMEYKLKQVIVKQSPLIIVQIFEQVGI